MHSQGENWNVLMYDCWRATSWFAPIYFLSLVILGGFVVMNVFLAILLNNFDSDVPVGGYIYTRVWLLLLLLYV